MGMNFLLLIKIFSLAIVWNAHLSGQGVFHF